MLTAAVVKVHHRHGQPIAMEGEVDTRRRTELESDTAEHNVSALESGRICQLNARGGKRAAEHTGFGSWLFCTAVEAFAPPMACTISAMMSCDEGQRPDTARVKVGGRTQEQKMMVSVSGGSVSTGVDSG